MFDASIKKGIITFWFTQDDEIAKENVTKSVRN